MTVALGWLRVNGVEVLNNARTAAYAEQLSVYSFPRCEDCRCAVVDEGNYTTPAADEEGNEDPNPAPWWSADCDPAANEFYGVFANSLGIGSGRNTRSSSGQSRRQYVAADTREITVEAVLFGTRRGRRYGRQWLVSQLSDLRCCPGRDCPPTVYADILLACEEDETWTLANLELVEIVDNPTDDVDCDAEAVTITLQADAYMWRQVDGCTVSDSPTPWAEVGDVDESAIRLIEWCDFACCSSADCLDAGPDCIEPRGRFIERGFPTAGCFCVPWYVSRKACPVGDLCTADRIGFSAQLNSDDEVHNLEISIWPDTTLGDPADNTGDPSPRDVYACEPTCFKLRVRYMPALSILTVDARGTRPEVTLECAGEMMDARHLVSFPSPTQPVSLDGSQAMWVAVDQDAENIDPGLIVAVNIYAGTEA